MNPYLSIIVPAYNEEKYLPKLLASIDEAKKQISYVVEVIVVDNNSKDKTAWIAREWGAKVVSEKLHNIASVRNKGAASASGEVVLTVDADSIIHPLTLKKVYHLMKCGDVIGGSVDILPDKKSFYINFVVFIIKFIVHYFFNLGGGIYFCLKQDFDFIKGFDSCLYAAEDLDFSSRLKRLGQEKGQQYLKCIKDIPIITSTRKFEKVKIISLIKLFFLMLLSPKKTLRTFHPWESYFYSDNIR